MVGPRTAAPLDLVALEATIRAIAPRGVALGTASIACAPNGHDRRAHPAAGDDVAGRAAGIALARLGIAADPPLRAPGRARAWPYGTVGAISHGRGVAIAIAARTSAVALLGIDLERRDAPDEDIAPLVCTAAERAARPDAVRADEWLMLHFSAKESVYKAIFARVGRFVDFSEVTLSVDHPARSFAPAAWAPSLGRCGLDRLVGRFAFAADLIVTLVHAPARPAGQMIETPFAGTNMKQ